MAAYVLATLVAGGSAASERTGFQPPEQEALSVPSGQEVTFHEMVWDQPGGGLIYRFRFVAPGIGPGGLSFEEVIEDMQVLCDIYALPRLADIGPQPRQVVISLASEATEFGMPRPDVTQFFEAYSIHEGRCIWEIF